MNSLSDVRRSGGSEKGRNVNYDKSKVVRVESVAEGEVLNGIAGVVTRMRHERRDAVMRVHCGGLVRTEMVRARVLAVAAADQAEKRTTCVARRLISLRSGVGIASAARLRINRRSSSSTSSSRATRLMT